MEKPERQITKNSNKTICERENEKDGGRGKKLEKPGGCVDRWEGSSGAFRSKKWSEIREKWKGFLKD